MLGRASHVGHEDELQYGVDPLVFDERGLCYLEAKEIDFAVLAKETWESHSTDHEGGDRTYFAAHRCNREGIIEVLRRPALIRRIADRFGCVYWFQARVPMQIPTKGGVVTPPRLMLLTVKVRDHKVLTFHPTGGFHQRGELIWP